MLNQTVNLFTICDSAEFFYHTPKESVWLENHKLCGRRTMASGFLVLPDGRCLARRWSAHDEVLRAVSDQLGEELAAQQLKHWLLEQLPAASDEEELGYGAWFRTADQQVVVRHIDLRQMTVENQHLFCEAAKRAVLVDHPEEWPRGCLSDLC